MDTAIRIQRILREELKESTVITIAHRLDAVLNADFLIILQNGKVVTKGSTTAQTMESSLFNLAGSEV